MRTFKLLVVMSVLLMSSGCAIYHHYDPYYGKVIDTETKAPLEGAAVLAVYYTEFQTGVAGTIGEYLDAQETVTDKNGEFKIPSNNSFTFRPLNLFDSKVMFTVFKPGYGYYPMHPQVKPKFIPTWSLPSNEYVTVELPKLKKGENISWPSVNFDVPHSKQKKFINLLNAWHEQFGIEKYTEKSFERR